MKSSPNWRTGSLTKIPAVQLASAIGTIAIALILPPEMLGAAPTPTADEILQRMRMTIAEIPDVVSADAEFRVRVIKSLGAPPDCVFRGTVKVVKRHPTVSIGEQTTGLFCWIVNRYVIGRRLEATEDLEIFLSRFQFDVLGEKLVGNDHFYLVEGKARDPKHGPRKMIGWIDFERGLLVEGTVEYPWGRIDTEQTYTWLEGMWMLKYQVLYTPRFDASMEIVYSNFRFSSR